MKRLRSIVCLIVAFMVCSILFVGCGSKKNKETTTTITLAEAKEIILKALEIPTLSAQADEEKTTNRDIMEKLGHFELNSDGVMTCYNFETSAAPEKFESHENGIMTYDNYQITAASTKEVDVYANIKEVYYADQKYYTRSNEDDAWASLSTNGDSGELAATLAGMKALCGEEAFEHVYDDQAVKEITDTGYSLTLQGDLKKYLYLYFVVEDQLFTADNFEEYVWEPYANQTIFSQEFVDACGLKVTINFDNNDQIVSAVMDGMMIGFGGDDFDSPVTVSDYIIAGKVTLSKTDKDIQVPDWVRRYNEKNNIA